jgi:hypothetical protein
LTPFLLAATFEAKANEGKEIVNKANNLMILDR